MRELDFANDPANKKGNRSFPNLLSSAGNWIKAYVGKEDSCWPGKHSVRSIREKSEINEV
jgi:hypothetical protein